MPCRSARECLARGHEAAGGIEKVVLSASSFESSWSDLRFLKAARARDPDAGAGAAAVSSARSIPARAAGRTSRTGSTTIRSPGAVGPAGAIIVTDDPAGLCSFLFLKIRFMPPAALSNGPYFGPYLGVWKLFIYLYVSEK